MLIGGLISISLGPGQSGAAGGITVVLALIGAFVGNFIYSRSHGSISSHGPVDPLVRVVFDSQRAKNQRLISDAVEAIRRNIDDNVTDGDWTTIGGVTEYNDSAGSGNIRFKFARTASTATVFSLGPVQVVQFNTQGEAIDYFNSRAFYQNQRFEYSGLATTSSGAIAIDFTDEGFQDQPDAKYNIEMAADGDATLFYSSKSKTGFTINNGAGTNGVNWRVYRRDL